VKALVVSEQSFQAALSELEVKIAGLVDRCSRWTQKNPDNAAAILQLAVGDTKEALDQFRRRLEA
jgi:ABC-type nitrate/sulfonate/bicarbonate transport system substrate-binding protein